MYSVRSVCVYVCFYLLFIIWIQCDVKVEKYRVQLQTCTALLCSAYNISYPFSLFFFCFSSRRVCSWRHLRCFYRTALYFYGILFSVWYLSPWYNKHVSSSLNSPTFRPYRPPDSIFNPRHMYACLCSFTCLWQVLGRNCSLLLNVHVRTLTVMITPFIHIPHWDDASNYRSTVCCYSRSHGGASQVHCTGAVNAVICAVCPRFALGCWQHNTIFPFNLLGRIPSPIWSSPSYKYRRVSKKKCLTLRRLRRLCCYLLIRLLMGFDLFSV